MKDALGVAGIATLVSSISLCPCCGGSVGAATTASDPQDEPRPQASTLTMEENGGSVVKHLGDYTFFAGSIRLGVRAIVWRDVTRAKIHDPRIRLGFGYWGDEGALGTFLGQDFQENVFYQLSAEDCENLIGLLDDMQGTRFLPAEAHIQYRDLDGEYAGIRLRKFPESPIKLYFWDEPEMGGEVWLDIDPAEFRSFLTESVAIAKVLKNGDPSIEWP